MAPPKDGDAFDCIDDDELAAIDLSAVTASNQPAGSPAAPTAKACNLAAEAAGHTEDASGAQPPHPEPACALQGGIVPTSGKDVARDLLATKATSRPRPPHAEPACALRGANILIDPPGGSEGAQPGLIEATSYKGAM